MYTLYVLKKKEIPSLKSQLYEYEFPTFIESFTGIIFKIDAAY